MVAAVAAPTVGPVQRTALLPARAALDRRFLLAIIILYLLVFRLNVSEVGMFFSARYGGAPWSWDKFVNLIQHVWPVIFIATFGGLAYNMRVMRGNLLDVLNARLPH